MAQRRMFSMQIVDTDAFMDMPLSAQALYFHLGMRADDDGFVNNARRIQRLIGAADDDLKLLALKRFILVFDSGIVVIKHWRMLNTIKGDRYKPTLYQDEKATLFLKPDGAYTDRPADGARSLAPSADPPSLPRQPSGNHSVPGWNQDGTRMEPQVKLGKDKLGIGLGEVREEGGLKHTPSASTGKEQLKGGVGGSADAFPHQPPVIVLPLNDGTGYAVSQEQSQEWAGLYPAVDVIQQLRGMRGWLDANPQKRKTRRGIKKFINGWLSKEQDRGGSLRQSAKTTQNTPQARKSWAELAREMEAVKHDP